MVANTALIIIDLQNDFCPGGSLAVKDGDKAVAVANQLAAGFKTLVVTQDWHPPNHQSFASQHPGKKPGDQIMLNGIEQILWPDHCIANSWGAKLHPNLKIHENTHFLRKGQNPELDSYSAFLENDKKTPTGLHEELQKQNISELAMMGLATEYCVKFSVLDALQLGYLVHLYPQGCFAINRHIDDEKKAIEHMCAQGAKLATI